MEVMCNDGTVKKKGTLLTGVPYSQSDTQCNASSFLAYYKNGLNNGFYDIHPRDNFYDATYGVDCSGFVSFSWGVPRDTTEGFVSELRRNSSTKYEKIGSYTVSSTYSTEDVNTTNLKNSYLLIGPSDAVVYRKNGKGHSMLVIMNKPQNEKCTFLEAYGNFPAEVTYTYEQLAKKGYCPFTITDTYYNTFNQW